MNNPERVECAFLNGKNGVVCRENRREETLAKVGQAWGLSKEELENDLDFCSGFTTNCPLYEELSQRWSGLWAHNKGRKRMKLLS
ncbi:hypothetical protein A2165_03035 [Candidatus Curtissbacteria bacterium RBG_13_40_7]|uniref:Uncharacterized protein n=1 Tax=Candidatus Curtissbacteria bacterium RBG_13_40_7 TaxID=1797706 RepID=A0A1F5FVJ0_9BACT|nr:MAG: hypothetical protein A2165_03035 [Candidatus Curtissbacteria bacterium RBG_13_40_7]